MPGTLHSFLHPGRSKRENGEICTQWNSPIRSEMSILGFLYVSPLTSIRIRFYVYASMRTDWASDKKQSWCVKTTGKSCSQLHVGHFLHLLFSLLTVTIGTDTQQSLGKKRSDHLNKQNSQNKNARQCFAILWNVEFPLSIVSWQ